MNNQTIIYILLFIILLYYLCNYCCECDNKESFLLYSLKCPYCSKKRYHSDICPFRYGDTHNINTAFDNKSKKLTFGSFGGKSGKYFLFTCDNDAKSYINQMNIRSGNRIDGIEVKCTNNKSIKIGGNGGKLNELPVKQDGYKNLQVKSGAEIDKIIIDSKEFGGNGGGGPYILSCDNNGKIAGIYGKSGARLNNLGIICTQ